MQRCIQESMLQIHSRPPCFFASSPGHGWHATGIILHLSKLEGTPMRTYILQWSVRLCRCPKRRPLPGSLTLLQTTNSRVGPKEKNITRGTITKGFAMERDSWCLLQFHFFSSYPQLTTSRVVPRSRPRAKESPAASHHCS